MRKLIILTTILCAFSFLHSTQITFDCKMRQLAMDFARKIQPFRSRQHFQQLADALNGSKEDQNCNVTLFSDHPYGPLFPSFSSSPSSLHLFVDSLKGMDSNNGSIDFPFQTIQQALRTSRSVAGPSTIILRGGTFYLNETLFLTPQDKGLTLMNFAGEEVWVSGGILLKTKWTPFSVIEKKMVYYETMDNLGGGVDLIMEKHPNVQYLGSFDTSAECAYRCLKYWGDKACPGFTYYLPERKDPSLARKCFSFMDGYWGPVSGEHVVSGRLEKANIYVADLDISSIPGLRINGERSIRARFPNANPELGFGSTLLAKAWLPPTVPKQPQLEIYPPLPIRDTGSMFQRYNLGVGGPCDYFDPPAGFWCGNETDRGGNTYMARWPSGLVADKKVLPNSPYKSTVGAVVHAWREYHWFSLMWEVGAYESSNGTFQFSNGGYQGAEGDDRGEMFYIENVFEELDSPNEWYYDKVTQKLYLWYNGTGAPSVNDVFVATNLKTLISIKGTMENPVQGVSILGINFRDTAYTYLDPHGMPSGGDWALPRSGAIFIEGTENVIIDSCIFTHLDGNGVMISGYNRFATLQKSTFQWIGATAIAAWGYTEGAPVHGMGWDGTKGEQPRYTQIRYNFVHELGIWQKQSSFYFQAQSCLNSLVGNIFFNGPRAGINFNDGFGGGSNITENLLLNTCRESGDHGPFNSWDRQVYVTVRDGNPTTLKEWDYIFNNFIIANYQSQEAIDNDDGSCYYKTYNNFFAYGGNGMKNDFGGHDNRHYNNIYAYVGIGFDIDQNVLEGHEDHFFSNRVVLNADGNYGNGICKGPTMTVVYDNHIYSPTGSVSECGMPLYMWQQLGNDPGSSASVWPVDEVLIGWIQELLDL